VLIAFSVRLLCFGVGLFAVKSGVNVGTASEQETIDGPHVILGAQEGELTAGAADTAQVVASALGGWGPPARDGNARLVGHVITPDAVDEAGLLCPFSGLKSRIRRRPSHFR
jgi:hypothetical protein